mmetsp:Transcript_52541/g.118332  ORF Transcript_52541/g.118332 Transcript_52541/m.118332 type:complete len:214 (-) Transcript_52541:2101-2742(-)
MPWPCRRHPSYASSCLLLQTLRWQTSGLPWNAAHRCWSRLPCPELKCSHQPRKPGRGRDRQNQYHTPIRHRPRSTGSAWVTPPSPHESAATPASSSSRPREVEATCRQGDKPSRESHSCPTRASAVHRALGFEHFRPLQVHAAQDPSHALGGQPCSAPCQNQTQRCPRTGSLPMLGPCQPGSSCRAKSHKEAPRWKNNRWHSQRPCECRRAVS